MLTLPLGALMTLLLSASPAGAPLAALAQRPANARTQTSGAVAVDAPVFLLPDATRTPLRTLAAGTFLSIGEIREGWVQVTFNDGALGARTGWIERRFVTMGNQAPDAAAEPAAIPAPPPDARTAPRRPQLRQPRSSAAPGLRGFASVMVDAMDATESFKAITGKSTVVSYGGGVQFVNLWRGLFVEASIERSSLDGERAFVFDDEVFPLGIPLKITMTPVDLVAGWRFAADTSVRTYAGAGATFLSYKETSEFADADENVDERYTGFVLMGGIDIGLWKWVHARGEVRYRRIDDALGVGGVSAAFDETRLGGFGGGLKIVVGR